MTAGPVRRPRVAMVVNNGMANDSRVIKSAVSLSRAGADVTAFGVASAGAPRAETRSGGARFVRLPVFPKRGLSRAYVTYAVRRRRGRLGPADRWRTALPATSAYAAAFAPALREHAPDVVHVHDVHLLDAVREAFADAAAPPRVVYDAHEYVAGLAVSGARTQRVVDGWGALERELIGSADRVITVSRAIADRIRDDHGLARTPAVVYNAPLLWPEPTSSRSLRDEAGVEAGQPLLVYSGALSAARGVDTVIRALPDVPEAMLAVVAVPHPHPMAGRLTELAGRLGVGDRVRFVPPVPSHEVPAYLASADVALSPIMGDAASYDMALPNKLFEFVHAGLPIVTSDIAAMSSFVTEHDLGTVFRQGDPGSCAVAIRSVLADPPRGDTDELRREFSWQSQEGALVRVYRELADEAPALGSLTEPTTSWRPEDMAVEFD